MAKKNSKKKDKKEKRKIREIKNKKKIIEKSELEKELEDSVENQEQEFRETPSPQIETTSRAPVLERIETPAINLEENLPQQTENQEERQEINYVQNQPKYADTAGQERTEKRRYESSFQAPVLEPQRTETNRGNFLMRGNEPRLQQEQNSEDRTMETPTMENERRLPFEQEQRKYKKVNFR